MAEVPDSMPPDLKAPVTKSRPGETAFIRQVGAKETRKLKAQRKVMRTVWSGFGMFGLIGWSVVVPTLLGTMLGVWLDKRYPGVHSWTLTLLLAGLCIGCWNAWHWMTKERKEMHAELEEKDE